MCNSLIVAIVIRKHAIPIANMSAKKLFSLVFIRNQQEILLGMKKRGFGKGKWNGFGGKILPQETLVQGALR